MATKKRKNIVVIGGGTGTFTVLTGLKRYPYDLTAIVAMSDDGGSTGVLRDELGVLPPGDVRQCLVALSSSDKLMRTLMNYRFEDGGLKGHSFGNLFLSALEKITGSFDAAVAKAAEVLRIEGRVIPATLEKTALTVRVNGAIIRGQSAVHTTQLSGKKKLFRLEPSAKANPAALSAIKSADAIVIGPGDFYSSLIPNLLVDGLSEAVCKSKAKKIYVCNLMSRAEHNKDFSVADFTYEIESYLGCPIDIVIYNNKRPAEELLGTYSREGEILTGWDELPDRLTIGANLVNNKMPDMPKVDLVLRNLIRHDPAKLAKTIIRAIK